MWVTNNSENDLEDGYDGKRYLFSKGQSVDVPLVVCHHVFGYGDDKKEPYLKRLGWMNHSQDLKKALTRLHSYSFSSERPKQNVHVLSPVVDSMPVLAPNKRKAGLVQVA